MSGGAIFFDDVNIPIGKLCTKNPVSGGADFFFDDVNTPVSKLCTKRFDCFIEFHLSNNIIKLNFNTKVAGSILYGGGLDTCEQSVIRGRYRYVNPY